MINFNKPIKHWNSASFKVEFIDILSGSEEYNYLIKVTGKNSGKVSYIAVNSLGKAQSSTSPIIENIKEKVTAAFKIKDHEWTVYTYESMEQAQSNNINRQWKVLQVGE